MRYLLGLCLVMLAACSTLTPAQTARNEDLFTAARSCQTGSLQVTGISTDGVPTTLTQGSGGSDKAAYEKCYTAKSAPIWQAYCQKNQADTKCK